MKPVDRRKALRDLRRLCKRHGITVTEDKGRGAGSHGSLVFTDASESDPIRVVIVLDRQISAGVQRTIIDRLKDRVLGAAIGEGARDLAERVYEVFLDIFDS